MTNVTVCQKKVKGHGQGHKFEIYGTTGNALPLESHMLNMQALSFRIKK